MFFYSVFVSLAVFFDINARMAFDLTHSFQYVLMVFQIRATYIFFTFLLILMFGQSACVSSRKLVSNFDKPISRHWDKLGLAEKYHEGITIYDTRANELLFAYNDHQYFTPASNIKILTMHASLKWLGDSLDAAWCKTSRDTLYIWGGGDPGVLYPKQDSLHRLISFLKQQTKAIGFSESHFMAKRYGDGWAWDDFPYTFQCERNAFPIYGNRLWVKRSADSITVTPAYLSSALTIKKDTITRISKSEWGDNYFYTFKASTKSDQQEIPITFFKNDIRFAWTEATGKEIFLSDKTLSDYDYTIKGSPRDTLIKIMMQQSDNFVAEQLLLACSMRSLGYMDDKAFIELFGKRSMGDIEDKIFWVDGSGLSRYNQVTPSAILAVLQKIYASNGLEYLKAILPAGGVSGNLKNQYVGKNGNPYLYAKSGSFSDTQCLSGLLVTKTGNILLFSWMHNNCRGNGHEIKEAMEKFFLFLCDHY